MKIAAIDIGTNSTRLLIAEQAGGKELKTLKRGLVTTRIGQGMKATGNLSPQGVGKTLEALKSFQGILRECGVDLVKIVATSAVRDAADREAFVRKVWEVTGWQVEVLTGIREAHLSYLGVTGVLKMPAKPLVIDVGGGSTEFIWQEQEQVHAVSVNAGAVRMTEGNHSRVEIQAVLDPALTEVQKAKPRALIGVGGTVTTLAAIEQKLTLYNPEKVHGYSIPARRVREILEDLAAKSLEERCQVPGLQPERADIIVAGITIVDIILQKLHIEDLVVSESGLLMGMILENLSK